MQLLKRKTLLLPGIKLRTSAHSHTQQWLNNTGSHLRISTEFIHEQCVAIWLHELCCEEATHSKTSLVTNVKLHASADWCWPLVTWSKRQEQLNLHTHTHTHTHRHTHTHTQTHTRARARARTRTQTHTHAPTHAHADTHRHTHTHTTENLHVLIHFADQEPVKLGSV
jgi:hypothetical protein